MRIERRQQRGAFVDEADPSMAVAMNTALVAFGVSKPAFEVEVVLWAFSVIWRNNRTCYILSLGLTACSGDSGRDTVENHPTIVCGHACGGTDGARHAPSDLPRRLSRL
jgi:hypothetical protein